MDGNSTPSRNFLTLLKKLTEQFSLIKWQKYIFFNLAKLQIWYLRCICCNTFLNLFYCQATSVILQMNVATTYQLKKMVIVRNFKNLMFKAMCNSHQHLYSRKTKGHIQGLLQSNKGRRYKKHFKVVFQSLRFSMHNLVLMNLWFWY